MIEVFKPELVVFAPAFPKAGRTTEDGIQKVNGTPLLETEMVRDPRNPIAYDNIVKLLSEGLNVAVTHHDLEEVRRDNLTLANVYHTFDAVYTSDMQMIAKSVNENHKRTLWIGSAGLAEGFFAEKYPNRPVLAIMGSVSESSMMQMEYAHKHHIPIIEIDMKAILDGADYQVCAEEAVNMLKSGSDLILTAARTKNDYQQVLDYAKQKNISGADVSALTKETIGKLASAILEQVKVSGLFMTGGDTAISVINHLGAQGSRIDSEVLTGFVLSRLQGGANDGLPIITKAGAFGGLKDVYYCIYRMKELSA